MFHCLVFYRFISKIQECDELIDDHYGLRVNQILKNQMHGSNVHINNDKIMSLLRPVKIEFVQDIRKIAIIKKEAIATFDDHRKQLENYLFELQNIIVNCMRQKLNELK